MAKATTTSKWRSPSAIFVRRAIPLSLLVCLLLPCVAAGGPGKPGTTDGIPFERDSTATLAALNGFRAPVSGLRIHDCIANITADYPASYRLMGTPTESAFVAKYKGVFSDLGLASTVQSFTQGGPGIGVTALTGGANILGVLPGTDRTKWIVLGAHYDTRELVVGGGALDNTSGICTVLELARDLVAANRMQPLEASIVFAWYDGEEWGLYGSQAFAQNPTPAKQLLGLHAAQSVDILASLSFDMAGLNWPAKNTWVQYGDPATTDETAVLNLRTAPTQANETWSCFSYGCYEELKGRPDFAAILDRNVRYQGLVREVAYDLVQAPREFVWVDDDDYGRSDHIPLIANGSAGMRIQGSHDAEYPHYHQPTDTLPALYELAGGKELLVQGFQAEAAIGGTVAYYLALTGTMGEYGVAHLSSNIAPTSSEEPVPALGLVTCGFLLLVAVAARRRR